MPRVPSTKVIKRRELVRTLRLNGLSKSVILEVLEKKKHLDGYSKTRHSQMKVLREDIAAIQVEDHDRFSVGGEEYRSGREDYIARLIELFRAAFNSRQYAVARGVAKDIAMQFGVPTEEAVKVQLEGTIEHVVSIVQLVKEYHPDNRIVKELDSIVSV